MIVYEHPLSERVRTLLRLEDLFGRFHCYESREVANDHHIALLLVFEILEVASRADLKSDLLQELDRQKQVLLALRGNPEISEDALSHVLNQIESASTQLLQASGKLGQELRDNEWLMSIKQRTVIPGGVCQFDLPSYYFWLQQSSDSRRQALNQWIAPFLPTRDAMQIVLKLLRGSSKATQQIAQQGVYQQMIGGRVAQMLRVSLDDQYNCVPEISANKYALNIRFTVQEGAQRPKPAEDDIAFELTFCAL